MSISAVSAIKSCRPVGINNVIKKGNQFVRTKTVVTPLETKTAQLKGDEMFVDGQKVEFMPSCYSGDLSKADMAKVFF